MASESVPHLTHPPQYPRSSGAPSRDGSRRPSLPRRNRRLRKGCFPGGQESGITTVGPSLPETSLSASTSISASPVSLPLPPLPLHLHLCILPLEVLILIRVTVRKLVDVDLLLLQLVPDLGADTERNTEAVSSRYCMVGDGEIQVPGGQRQRGRHERQRW